MDDNIINSLMNDRICNGENEELESYVMGTWGCSHLQWLKEHQRESYIELCQTGKLDSYLETIDRAASDMYHQIHDDLVVKSGLTEEYKMADMLGWVGVMNNIANIARAAVYEDLIYC